MISCVSKTIRISCGWYEELKLSSCTHTHTDWLISVFYLFSFLFIYCVLFIQLDSELFLAPGFASPPNLDYKGYHTYISESLPPETPYLYGLHPNAEIGFLTTTSENLFRTVLEMQPRDASGGGGSGTTREEQVSWRVTRVGHKLDTIVENVLLLNVKTDCPFIVIITALTSTFGLT